ncbi:FHA domain-containing protein [Kitasatospora sp. NPDC002551]|uniref:FHA domain-containing protein n=1 Tax=Kitasatospora sp. NPDC002551 TaxID=3154539 RepID=UPI0033284DBF
MSPSSQDQVLPRLIVDNPDRIRGQVYELGYEPLLVGRDSTCRLQLVDPLLSRRHAVVRSADGHTTVEDLSSTNGTRLNGHRLLGERILHTGDVLSFGPLEVHYEEPAEAATAIAGPSGAAEGPEPPTLLTDGAPAAPPHPRGGAPVAVPARLAAAPAGPAPLERARPEKPEREDSPPGTPGAPPRPSAPPGSHPPRGVVSAVQAQLPRLDVPPPAAPRQGAGRFDVDQQRAMGNLSNVNGNQYNYTYRDDHLELARRETFFRKLATARTIARHLMVTGLVLALLGSAFLGWEGNQDVLDGRVQSIAHTASVMVGVAGAVLLVVGGAVLIRSVIRQRRYEKEEERRLNPDPSPSG